MFVVKKRASMNINNKCAIFIHFAWWMKYWTKLEYHLVQGEYQWRVTEPFNITLYRVKLQLGLAGGKTRRSAWSESKSSIWYLNFKAATTVRSWFCALYRVWLWCKVKKWSKRDGGIKWSVKWWSSEAKAPHSCPRESPKMMTKKKPKADKYKKTSSQAPAYLYTPESCSLSPNTNSPGK